MTLFAEPFMPIIVTEAARAAGLYPEPFPMELLRPHAAQALLNHGQTLERLRDRGGLDATELLAILQDRPWCAMSEAEAFRRIAGILILAGAPT